MTRNEFEKALTDAVNMYIGNWYEYGDNAQVRVNPLSKRVDLLPTGDFAEAVEDSDEAVENAAIINGAAQEDADDYQVEQNPDFYAVRDLLLKGSDAPGPDKKAIERIVRIYY